MTRDKINALRCLSRSRLFVLVTDREAIVQGDVKGFDEMMVIHALKECRTQLDKVLKDWETRVKGGSGGRNKARRKVRSSNQ